LGIIETGYDPTLTPHGVRWVHGHKVKRLQVTPEGTERVEAFLRLIRDSFPGISFQLISIQFDRGALYVSSQLAHD
jgi:hypothetical protein